MNTGLLIHVKKVKTLMEIYQKSKGGGGSITLYTLNIQFYL